MTCAVTTFPEFSPFDSLADALSAFRWSALRRAAIGLGAMAGAGATVAFVPVAAIWIVAVGFSVHPHLSAKAPAGLQGMVQRSASLLQIAAVDHAVSAEAAPTPAPAQDMTVDAEPVLTATPTYILASATPILPTGVFERGDFVSLPSAMPRPATAPRAHAQLDQARAAIGSAVPKAEPADALITASIPQQPLPPERPRDGSGFLPHVDSKTAVYDIAAHTVYMPDGTRLEAHSGRGRYRDDPDAVHKKNRGPTPPNVYDLKMREARFHGVRAIRLNPVPGSTMFGRDGMLAHTYMLGSRGQSQGCVSFKKYNKFLQAFLRGEVTRMVVVPRLGTEISQLASAQRSSIE
ncbi:MAG: DUF2778 domain-containing protein [Rhodoplanes sp.]